MYLLWAHYMQYVAQSQDYCILRFLLMHGSIRNLCRLLIVFWELSITQAMSWFVWDQHSLSRALEFVGHWLQTLLTPKLTKHWCWQQLAYLCKIHILLQHLQRWLNNFASLLVHIQQIMNIFQSTPWPPCHPYDPWHIRHLGIWAIQFCKYKKTFAKLVSKLIDITYSHGWSYTKSSYIKRQVQGRWKNLHLSLNL